MTHAEAKEILRRWRPGLAVIDDPDLSEAMQLAQRDPQLRTWLDRHSKFQKGVSDKLRQLTVPPNLRQEIILGAKLRRKSARLPSLLALAAVAAISFIGVFLFMRPPKVDKSFAAFQRRMANFAEREYRMDIVTNDWPALRQFLQERNAPTSIELKGKLGQTPLKGGARLSWLNHPVSMICFDHEATNTLFLFVLDRSALQDGTAPSARPAYEQMGSLTTASWSDASQVYFLAGPHRGHILQFNN